MSNAVKSVPNNSCSYTLTAEKLANQRPINNNMGHSLMFKKEINARTCDVA